ncbi:MAG: hypothetical protein GXO22_00870 [Aquificae bacterium]|nr:hypothetical protein [Aquificota bacterium]
MKKLDLDFRELNILFNSKEESFKEFCCHLAYELEEVPDGIRYFRFRGAGGNGGVEYILELPRGAKDFEK